MRIGVPKEIKSNENRIGIVPAGVQALTADGHRVLIEDGLLDALRADSTVGRLLGELEPAVREGRVPATSAARQILNAFRREPE